MTDERELQARERLARHWSEAEPSVHAFVFAAINRYHEAEEVVQQVALTVVRRFDEYDETRPFIAWALWLAKSRIADHYRQRSRQRRTCSDEVLDHMADVLVQRQPEGASKQEALEHCLDGLSDKSRRLIQLRYLDDQPVADVAEAIGSTEGSVRVMLCRIRQALAQCIRTRLGQEVSS